jgi:hypothetical protein
VVRRLKTYGKLSQSEARSVIEKVSQRMKLAADVSSKSDPLRVAVSTALYDEPVPTDQAGMSMVRLRLYAGLNKWALENLFSSRSSVTKICSGQAELDADECRALLAAAQGVRFNNVSPIRMAAPQEAAYESEPAERHATLAAAPAPIERAPARAAATLSDDPEASPSPIHAGRRASATSAPAISKAPLQPPPASGSVEQRKAQYAAQREAYLERRRQEMQARKAKIIATAGGERAQRGPATQEEAEVAGLKPANGGGRASAMVASRSETPATSKHAASHDNSGEDGELLEGLMDNPLGKSE